MITIKEKGIDRFFNILNFTLLGLVLVIIIYPLWFVIIASISDPDLVNAGKVMLIPKRISLKGYSRVLQNRDILMSYKNSIIYVLVGTSINMVLTLMCAYGLSRKEFGGRNFFTFLFTFTMFFSGGLIATFLVVKQVGIIYTDSSSISSWSFEAIGRATQKGFLVGNQGKFNPQANTTRAEFTKMIVAILGLDTNADKAITFTDVEEDKWFYPYINAAYIAGIVKGSGNEFNPDNNITREEMAAIIVRALGIKAAKTDLIAGLKDFDKVSEWAKGEVETAVAYGLMIGDNLGYFTPSAFATREMAAVVSMRGFDYINSNNPGDKEEKKTNNVIKIKI
jgi:hypothetical protein